MCKWGTTVIAAAVMACGQPAPPAAPNARTDWLARGPGNVTLEGAVVGLRASSKTMIVARSEPLNRAGLSRLILDALPADTRQSLDEFQTAAGVDLNDVLEGVVLSSPDELGDFSFTDPDKRVLLLVFSRVPITLEFVRYLDEEDDGDDSGDDSGDSGDSDDLRFSFAWLAPVTPEAHVFMLEQARADPDQTLEVIDDHRYLALAGC